NPYREATTDPGRVRDPESPTHPAEITAVLGDDLCGQGPDEGSLGRVAVLVEPVRLRLGLLHRSDNQPPETTCPRASPIDFVTARTVMAGRGSDRRDIHS